MRNLFTSYLHGLDISEGETDSLETIRFKQNKNLQLTWVFPL